MKMDILRILLSLLIEKLKFSFRSYTSHLNQFHILSQEMSVVAVNNAE